MGVSSVTTRLPVPKVWINESTSSLFMWLVPTSYTIAIPFVFSFLVGVVGHKKQRGAGGKGIRELFFLCPHIHKRE